MFIVTSICIAVSYVLVRYCFFRKPNSVVYTVDDVDLLRHQVEVFKRAAGNMTDAYTEEEEAVNDLIQQKLDKLVEAAKIRISKKSTISLDHLFQETLNELETKYVIRDMPLLIKGGLSLAYSVSMFLLHSVPNFHHMSYAWASLSGMLLFMILAEKSDNFEHYLHQVEFATLLFFACLFILVECLSQLGLIPFIGQFLENMLLKLPSEWRLTVAIIMILWVGGLTSAFVDNIPVTTMMIMIIEGIHRNQELQLPLVPLVVTLALSTGIGSNGTQIAATTNIVATGIAEQHGYKISFKDFFV